MKKRSKSYRQKEELLKEKDSFSFEESVDLAIQTSVTKFDSTVEIHFNLNADVKHADQVVRSTVILPHGTGKTVRIAAFVGTEKEAAAKKAGADVVGTESLIDAVNNGKIDFDVAVATPDQMKSIAKVAKILGQKGLMPNPKAGTVTPDIEKAIEDLKKGKVEFKTDKHGIIHTLIGKVSFGKEKLLENLKDLVQALFDAKPTGIKGVFLKSITLTTTMGPGISVDLSDVSSMIGRS